MIRGIKTGTIIVLSLLVLTGMILAAIGGMVAFSLIAVGYLFLYYLVIFGLTHWANKNENTARWKQYTLLLVFSLPILWLLVDPYSIGEWLMSGVKLDMK